MHQLKIHLKLGPTQVDHPSATIGQLQIFGLTGRHLGAKPKMKLNLQPNMGPQANHKHLHK